jgi:hypothetical protein
VGVQGLREAADKITSENARLSAEMLAQREELERLRVRFVLLSCQSHVVSHVICSNLRGPKPWSRAPRNGQHAESGENQCPGAGSFTPRIAARYFLSGREDRLATSARVQTLTKNAFGCSGAFPCILRLLRPCR